MMHRILLLAGCGLLLAACAGDPSVNREAVVELEPMEKPMAPPTDLAWTGTGGGVDKLVSNDEGRLSWVRSSDGVETCAWTNDGWFSPSWEWRGCNSTAGDGHQEFTKEGDIWPLQVGSKEVYEVTGKSEKYTWEYKQTCEVKNAVLLTVVDKQLPSYEVVCSDKYGVKTWYVSPELGQVLRHKRVHRKQGVLEDVTAEL